MKTALLLEDIQNDFFPDGALPIAGAEQVIAPANRLILLAVDKGWSVFLSRNWHPERHISFWERGGKWPPHCIANQPGAYFHPELKVPEKVVTISKATAAEKEAYSSFDGTDLAERLKTLNVGELIVAGLTTEYCVKYTVLDALKHGLTVTVAEDAIRAVDAEPGDGVRAIAEMKGAGAVLLPVAMIIMRYYQ